MKTKILSKTLISLSFILLSGGAIAATTATGNMSATVSAAIDVTANNALTFGSFTAGSSSGTITQDGIVTGGVGLIGAASAGRQAGTFTVSGQPSTTYNFTLQTSATLTSGANNMTVALSFASGSTSRTLSGSGTDVVTVNGTLSVGANQVIGSYTGTYNVSVNY